MQNPQVNKKIISDLQDEVKRLTVVAKKLRVQIKKLKEAAE